MAKSVDPLSLALPKEALPKQPIDRWLDMLQEERGADTAIYVLTDMGVDAVAPVIQLLLHAPNRTTYENAGEVLVRIGEPAVLPLLDLLQQGDAGAAWLLGQIRDRRAVEPLMAVLNSKNRYLRWSAVNALANIGAAESMPALIPKLRDRASLVRLAAVNALAMFGDASAIDGLLKLVTDRSPGIRMASQQAVERIQARAQRS